MDPDFFGRIHQLSKSGLLLRVLNIQCTLLKVNIHQGSCLTGSGFIVHGISIHTNGILHLMKWRRMLFRSYSNRRYLQKCFLKWSKVCWLKWIILQFNYKSNARPRCCRLTEAGNHEQERRLNRSRTCPKSRQRNVSVFLFWLAPGATIKLSIFENEIISIPFDSAWR